jgi:branched-chain amino acid transport system ATP-binding protein
MFWMPTWGSPVISNEPILEIRNLSAGYGKMRILTDLNLTIHQGEVVALVGTNGSGKTTLLRSICGFIQLSAGQITYLDDEITGLTPERRVAMGIALVPESREIFTKQSVLANLKLGAYLRLKGFGAEHYREDLDFVLSTFPILGQRLHQLAGTLSGGEQQMLAIGRALMSRPKLLILDEPSTGLAPLVVRNIFEILNTLNRQLNLTIFLVEQNTRLALKTAQRGYLLERGRIVKSDQASLLLEYLNATGLSHS